MDRLAERTDEMKISFRRIEKRDNPAVANLVREGLKSYGLDIPGTAYFDPHLDRLYEYYTERPDIRSYFVAEDETGRVVGGIGVDVFDQIEDCGELQKLYVASDAQRQGIGGRLIGLLENEAARLGYKKLYLETHSNLQSALRLYQNMGYELIAKPAFAMHETMDRFLIKELASDSQAD